MAAPESKEEEQGRRGSLELLSRWVSGGSAPSIPGSESEPLTSTRRQKWRKRLLYLAAYTRLIKGAEAAPKGWRAGTKALFLGSKLNLLLFVSVVVPFCRESAAASFVLSCLVLLPLAAMLGDLTEKVAYHTSETIGGLLNATFGNATEALVSIFALEKGLVRVVQVSLLGSVLSNMLLVLGSAFVAAGMKTKLAHFNRTAATANTGLLLVATLALLVPAMLQAAREITVPGEKALSRCTSVLMLGVYVAYLNFQLSSHSKLFDEEAEIERHAAARATSFGDVAMTAMARQNHSGELALLHDDDDDYVLRLDVALGWLAAVTVLVALFSELLTSTLEGFSEAFALPDAFVGFVLLPLVGNAAEHATAITMAYRNKIDLSVAVALGSSTQIALFVLPVMVILGWIIDQPLDLAFGSFETAITALSVLIVAFQAQMGEVHYLNGLVLVVAYLIIALAFYFVDQPFD